MTDILLANDSKSLISTPASNPQTAVSPDVTGISSGPQMITDDTDVSPNQFSALLTAGSSAMSVASDMKGQSATESGTDEQTLPQNGKSLPSSSRSDAPVSAAVGVSLHSNVDPETVLYPVMTPSMSSSSTRLDDAVSTDGSVAGMAASSAQAGLIPPEVQTVIKPHASSSGDVRAMATGSATSIPGDALIAGKADNAVSGQVSSQQATALSATPAEHVDARSPGIVVASTMTNNSSIDVADSTGSDMRVQPQTLSGMTGGNRLSTVADHLSDVAGPRLHQSAESVAVSRTEPTISATVVSSIEGRSAIETAIKPTIEPVQSPGASVLAKAGNPADTDALNTRMAQIVAADKAGINVDRLSGQGNTHVIETDSPDMDTNDRLPLVAIPKASQSQTDIRREIASGLQSSLRMINPDKPVVLPSGHTVTGNAQISLSSDEAMVKSATMSMQRTEVATFTQSMMSSDSPSSQQHLDARMIAAMSGQSSLQHAANAAISTPSAAVPTGMEALTQNHLHPVTHHSTSPAAILHGQIAEHFAKPDWSTGMARQVMMMVDQNINRAELRLNPANLGSIEVRIEVIDDQVNVAMNSRHSAVRDSMEQALPRLREMFEEHGMNLAGTDISQHSFSEQRGDAPASDSRATSHTTLFQAGDDSLPEQLPGHNTTVSDALVDCYT